jgi:hypothetical protein
MNVMYIFHTPIFHAFLSFNRMTKVWSQYVYPDSEGGEVPVHIVTGVACGDCDACWVISSIDPIHVCSTTGSTGSTGSTGAVPPDSICILDNRNYHVQYGTEVTVTGKTAFVGGDSSDSGNHFPDAGVGSYAYSMVSDGIVIHYLATPSRYYGSVFTTTEYTQAGYYQNYYNSAFEGHTPPVGFVGSVEYNAYYGVVPVEVTAGACSEV